MRKIALQNRIHCLGIGGVGVSAIAEVLHAMGCTVSGSDLESSYLTKRLESKGVRIQYSHEPDLIKDADIVMYSSAVGESNAERRYAAENGIRQMRRAEMLGQLMRNFFCVAVAGTHGKTTTTSLVGHVLDCCQKSPTILTGGVVKNVGSNVKIGDSDIMVVEADEYDRSFLALYPTVAILLNIEEDHLDIYRDLEDITESFVSFTDRIPFYGNAIVCIDEPGITPILSKIPVPVTTFSTGDAEADWFGRIIEAKQNHTRFEVFYNGENFGTFTMSLCGTHNVRNALAAIAVCQELGCTSQEIITALDSFSGVKRRFEVLGQVGTVVVIDDYAHHPSEIAATIDAAQQQGYTNIIVAFQPHLYTRTRDLYKEFAASLSRAQKAVLLPIYKAREETMAGVSSELIVSEMIQNGYEAVTLLDEVEMLPETVAGLTHGNTAVILMGAGDIWKQGEHILERLSK